MNQSVLHDTLIQCATHCREFVYENRCDVRLDGESIILSIDCAELCCQTAVLHRNGSTRTAAVARQCIRTCESLLQQLSYSADLSTHQLADGCKQALRGCRTIVEKTMARDQPTQVIPATVCYGIQVPTGVYPA